MLRGSGQSKWKIFLLSTFCWTGLQEERVTRCTKRGFLIKESENVFCERLYCKWLRKWSLPIRGIVMAVFVTKCFTTKRRHVSGEKCRSSGLTRSAFESSECRKWRKHLKYLVVRQEFHTATQKRRKMSRCRTFIFSWKKASTHRGTN